MKNSKLKIGRIPYANLFPTFYYMDNKCDLSCYTFFTGVPSVLNKMLRDGKLDISPSSSIEFLRNKNKYCLIPWFSISSSGAIGSILLFSKLPLEKLNGKAVAVSSDSDTSAVLLKVILREFLSFKCKFQPITQRSVSNVLKSFDAVLYIGDTAMIEAKKSGHGTPRTKYSPPIHPSPSRGEGKGGGELYVYDLGELWFKHTGLPFVFALWIVRKNTVLQKKELLKKFSLDLINAKKYALKSLSSIAKMAPQKKWLSEEELVNFWQGISYDFTDKHLEGLRLFEKYAVKL